MHVAGLMALFSVLIPTRMWLPPNEPIRIMVKADEPVNLILTEFTGKLVDTDSSTEVPAGGKEVDLRAIYNKAPNALAAPGCFILYAVPKGKWLEQFVGTPLVIELRADKRAATDGPMVVNIEPLCYAVMSSDRGDMTLAFYYDTAPNTTAAFLTLAEQGFYDGLIFHRIIPDFVVQGGDPLGSGLGGPGYSLDAEFSDRPHDEGVLSMARQGDPLEPQGLPPRSEYANSAGSQFFICLARKEHLDRRYTAFGKVIAGQETYRAIAKAPLADAKTGRPEKPPVIKTIEVKPVTAEQNPYRNPALFSSAGNK